MLRSTLVISFSLVRRQLLAALWMSVLGGISRFRRWHHTMTPRLQRLRDRLYLLSLGTAFLAAIYSSRYNNGHAIGRIWFAKKLNPAPAFSPPEGAATAGANACPVMSQFYPRWGQGAGAGLLQFQNLPTFYCAEQKPGLSSSVMTNSLCREPCDPVPMSGRRFRSMALQPGRVPDGGQRIFIWICRNPLISPDSDE